MINLQKQDEFLVDGKLIFDNQGNKVHESEAPLKWAIQNLNGCFVVKDGEYEIGTIKKSAGTFELPIKIIAENPGQAKLKRVGAAGWGDTIVFVGNVSHLHFEGLYIPCSGRSGVLTAENGLYDNITFKNCEIDGGWIPQGDVIGWVTKFDENGFNENAGFDAKWGFLLNRVKNFKVENCSIHSIRREHAFYFHNNLGPVLLDNLKIWHCGRTAVQVVSREIESGKPQPPGVGVFWAQNLEITDVGISPLDGGVGGANLTVTGRHLDKMVFAGCKVRSGFDSSVKHLKPKNKPYGVRAFVSWHGGEDIPLKELILAYNDFEYAKDSGQSSLVSIRDVTKVNLWENRFVAGASNCIEIDDPKVRKFEVQNIIGSGFTNDKYIGNCFYRGDKIVLPPPQAQ